ncbi:hypothetical protein [Paraburkholderia sp. ZP32-5]|uniref:hypothetical protein n=1 Tax=Paraburkholderia sp. ZP32-5 TaxID=2883245 RepID=UPI001F187374|nr:hypothetical protein [Paraburkholderia sp. ZP32-5]
MNSNDLRKSYEFSVKGTTAKITLVMSILSVVRLIVDLRRLPLSALLANILKTYQVVFHTCVDVLLFWLPYRLPPWGKDLLIFYSLLAFVFLRVLLRQAQFNYRHPWIILHNYGNSRMKFFVKTGWHLFKTTLLWPVQVLKICSSPYLVVANGGHGPSALYFSKTRPVEGTWQGLYFGDARIMMLVRLTAIVLGAFVVIAFNYAFSI